jgi:hypothetical protein
VRVNSLSINSEDDAISERCLQIDRRFMTLVPDGLLNIISSRRWELFGWVQTTAAAPKAIANKEQ